MRTPPDSFERASPRGLDFTEFKLHLHACIMNACETQCGLSRFVWGARWGVCTFAMTFILPEMHLIKIVKTGTPKYFAPRKLAPDREAVIPYVARLTNLHACNFGLHACNLGCAHAISAACMQFWVACMQSGFCMHAIPPRWGLKPNSNLTWRSG